MKGTEFFNKIPHHKLARKSESMVQVHALLDRQTLQDDGKNDATVKVKVSRRSY